MASVNPYLNFNGNCQEVFNFYKSVFGGEFSALMRFKDMPVEYQGDKSESEKIMHIALPIGQGTMLMGSDTPAAMGSTVQGNNFGIAINTASEAEANKLFKGLSTGGQVTMPLEKAFWGDYFGMLDDKFGISWMVSFSPEQPR